jgi:hypothetical protein
MMLPVNFKRTISFETQVQSGSSPYANRENEFSFPAIF